MCQFRNLFAPKTMSFAIAVTALNDICSRLRDARTERIWSLRGNGPCDRSWKRGPLLLYIATDGIQTKPMIVSLVSSRKRKWANWVADSVMRR